MICRQLCVKYTIVNLFFDCKSLKISIIGSHVELQYAIDSLFEWSQKCGMDFNIKK